LLEFRRECQAGGRQVRIRNLPPRLADLAALYGIAELLSAPQ
jgi:ABC-type transporter Mla MlaB component